MTNSKRIIEACGVCTDVVKPLGVPTDCSNCTEFERAWAKVMEKLRYGG